MYTCGCPPPCTCVSGMYTEEDGRTTVQSKAQDDDNRRVRNYILTKKRRSVCGVKRGVRYSMAEYNIHFINQGIIVRISKYSS